MIMESAVTTASLQAQLKANMPELPLPLVDAAAPAAVLVPLDEGEVE